MNIIWSPRANVAYRQQINWLEANRNPKAVLRYLHEVADALDSISNPLARYRPVPGFPDTYQFPLNQHTVLYYRVKGNDIQIVSIFDTRQDPDKRDLS